MGVPPLGLDRYPFVETGWGYSTLGLDGGTPPPPSALDDVPPSVRSNRASTCYKAGGMALAFTQDNFLVDSLFC